MKNAPLFLLALSLLTACNRAEKTQDSTVAQSSATDSVAAVSPTPKNCQQVVDAADLGKTNVFQESAKPISVSITVEQSENTTQATGGCYFDNAVTVRANKKSGSYLFKRTFDKGDLVYFSKNDEAIERSILQTITYKPSFNGQKYMTLTMRLIDPESKKKTDYELFLNYFGEIVKVR